MTDKKIKLTKLVKNFAWILTILFVVGFFLALAGVQGISDKVTQNPDNYPSDWGMIGLGLVAMILMLGIFQLIFIVLAIPTAVFKKRSLKDGRTSVVDMVFTFLLVAISMPCLVYGLIMVVNMFQLFTYGLGFGFIPYTIAILLHLAFVALMIVQLILCWPKKKKTEVAEATPEAVAE